MKRFLPLLILTGLLFGQDKKDIIELTDGSIYQGEYVKIEDGNVYFKPESAFGVQPIEIYKVRKLELSDGLVLIRYGTKVDSDYKRISPEAQFVRNCILGAAGCYLLAYLLIMSSAAQIDISTGL
jgi:hypothetical protein